MEENPKHDAAKTKSQSQAEQPGLLQTIGSFPVWLLKIIQMITPGFLISKDPPKKKNYRI